MYTFVVNRHSRSGLGGKVWEELEQILKERAIKYEVHFTEYQRHATAIANKITSDKEAHTIVALGGDGTINEVVNGIVDFDKTTLGYIPVGSGNDFARGLKLPTDPKAALEVILSETQVHPINIGTIAYGNRIRRFAVSSGLGYDAAICHEVVVSKVKQFLNRIGLGKLTYVFVALHRLFASKLDEMTLILDHEKEVRFSKTYFAAFMNNPFEGGGLMFAPDAKNDDDLLDVVVASDIPKLKILRILPTTYKGKHTRFKGIHMYTAKHIEVHSKCPLAIHTDGEPIYLHRDVVVSCEDQKLGIIVPQKIS